LHRYEEFTPAWRIMNRVLSLVLALLILLGSTYLLTLTLRLDGADAEEQGTPSIDTVLPDPSNYEEPNVRIGLCYGSSVRAKYSFTATERLIYGYNRYQYPLLPQ